MIGTYYSYLTITQRLAQSFAISSGLYCRVAFDACALHCVIFIREHEMSHNSLACNIFILTEELQFLSRSNVGDMEMRPAFLSQLHRQTAAFIASLLAAYFRMMFYGRVLTPFLLSQLHIAVNDFGILTVGHHRQIQLFRLLEDSLQRLIFIHQHIARTGAHKELDSRNTMRIELLKIIYIIIGSTKEETVVHMTLLSAQLPLCLPGLQSGSLRYRVRHLKITGHTTKGSSAAFALDVSLLRKSRLTEVNMIINHTRQNKTPRGIDDFIVIATGCLAFIYLLDKFTIQQEVAHKRATLIYNGSILD